MKYEELERMTKTALKKRIKEWDDKQWKEELEAKSSITIYRSAKNTVKEDPIYDNTPSSVILFRARTNTLPLRARRRHVEEETTCVLCGKEEENEVHFMLECTKLTEERQRNLTLLRPYVEEPNEVLKAFLFNDDRKEMEQNKDGLYRLWRLRRKLATEAGDEERA